MLLDYKIIIFTRCRNKSNKSSAIKYNLSMQLTNQDVLPFICRWAAILTTQQDFIFRHQVKSAILSV